MNEPLGFVQVLNKMEEKECYENYLMNYQHQIAMATLNEAFNTWKKEQLLRRKRFIEKQGMNVALEKGYHVPFWQWWMNKLLVENNAE